MATSTNDTIRTALVSEIQGIAVSSLGFQDTNGNVQSYLLDEEAETKRTGYLYANVTSGAKYNREIRAWAVQVNERETFDRAASQEVATRLYEIVIAAYYGAHGSTPVNTMRTHARAVRNAIYGINLHLGRRVDKFMEFGPAEFGREDIDDISDEVFSMIMIGEAEKYNPDY